VVVRRLLLGAGAPSLQALEHVEDDLRDAAGTHERSIEGPLPSAVAPVSARKPVIVRQHAAEQRRMAAMKAP
jgi:hypothetical protein